MKPSLLLLAAALGGCSSTSGVQRTGTDTFTVTVSASPGRGGVPAAKGMAYEQAAAECAKRRADLADVNETLASPSWTEGMAVATLTFRCAAAA